MIRCDEALSSVLDVMHAADQQTSEEDVGNEEDDADGEREQGDQCAGGDDLGSGGGAGADGGAGAGSGEAADGWAVDGGQLGSGTGAGAHAGAGSGSGKRSSGRKGAGNGGEPGAEAATPPSRTADISFTGQGKRMSASELRSTPAPAKIGAALGGDNFTWVTRHTTARIVARFEWGAPPVLQHLRATSSFHGKPSYSFVRYETASGGVGCGRVRPVLRSIGRQPRSCVVLQRMHPVEPRDGCVLTRFRCVRLAWVIGVGNDSYPALEVVDAARIYRAEDIQVDWFDLGDRLGLFATPQNKSVTADERRASRYFTNPFYPWTSRALRPGL